MKQAPDEITIVTRTPARAETLKQAITLRGFDQIACLDAEQVPHVCQINPPVLVIVDMEGDAGQTLSLLESLPIGVRSLVLADEFEEGFFLSCYDHGARDFMVNPVPEAMLVSHVIRNLQEHRLEQVAQQKDRIMVEMGVLSAKSGVFTTSYLINLLRARMEEDLSVTSAEPMSLLILQVGGYAHPLSAEARDKMMAKVGAIVKECARGLDEVGEYFVDKFAVVMPQTSRRGAKALAKRLQQRLQDMIFENGSNPWALTVQIGIAESNGCRNYEDFLNQALDDLKGLPTQQVAAAPVSSTPQKPAQVAPKNPPQIPPMSRPSNLI